MVMRELEASRRESETLSAENARLAVTVTHTSNDLTRVKFEVEELKAELESSDSWPSHHMVP